MRERGTGKFELSHNLDQDNETKQTHLFLILSLFSLFPRGLCDWQAYHTLFELS